MDPIVPQLENQTRRRRGRRLFNHARIPVRMLVPNFVTLLGLCWGLTSIRMSIEQRWELALGGIVLAAALDGVDGRVARYLKASSRFGAELDSLADFVNFGVAPAILLFTWGFQDIKSLGWICVLLFALASALRLARFNVASDEEKPKWQSNYFTGMPTPAAAIVVLLPLYLFHLGLDMHGSRPLLFVMFAYTLSIALMMVSSVPTYSGKLMGERIGREWVLPIFIVAMAFVACLVTYPYETLSLSTIGYLATIPWSVRRYKQLDAEHSATVASDSGTEPEATANPAGGSPAAVTPAPPVSSNPPSTPAGNGQVIGFRPGEPKR
jgi:CDP-diacylglycerol---serine O-phosphatidyltransferase